MKILAVVDRYVSNDTRPNALTEVQKYPMSDMGSAREFVRSIKSIDRRVLSANLEIFDV